MSHDFATIHPATEKLALESYSTTAAPQKKQEHVETPAKEKTPRTPREDRDGSYKNFRGGSSSYRTGRGSSSKP